MSLDFEEKQDNEKRLKGTLGTWQLMLAVLAFAAPIAVATGFIPLGFAYAGPSGPLVILMTLALMMLFVVGYIAMTKYIKRPGAFYSYISAGLGRVVGTASAFLAAASYFLVLVGAYAFTGVLVSDMIVSFGGPETSWVVWGAIAWVSVFILGLFNVDVSVRLMVFIMILEVALITAFDIGALAFSFSADSFSVEPLNPVHLSNANIPITMVFVVLMFIGFEGTAIYRDETKKPDVTVPRATYGAILLVGLLHFATSFSMYLIYGDGAQEIALNDPESMFINGIGMVLLPLFTKIAIVVVTTSQYASAIAVHNVVVRYTHSLALDGALPRGLARVHPRLKSPYRASVAVELFALVVLALIIGFGSVDDPTLYSQLMGVGLVGLILLMSLVSLAVIVYFARETATDGMNAARTAIAPGIAFLGLAYLAVYNVFAFSNVHGGNPHQAHLLFVILGVAIVAGSAVSLYFKYRKPSVYAGLGASRFTDQ